jgi:hypothetical protein
MTYSDGFGELCRAVITKALHDITYHPKGKVSPHAATRIRSNEDAVAAVEAREWLIGPFRNLSGHSAKEKQDDKDLICDAAGVNQERLRFVAERVACLSREGNKDLQLGQIKAVVDFLANGERPPRSREYALLLDVETSEISDSKLSPTGNTGFAMGTGRSPWTE